MILGIGVDIIEIERIDKAIKRNNKFLSKLFTDKEVEIFKSKNYKAETIAGKFAAKEAVAKALGTGFRGFSMIDIEILNDKLGKPIVNIKKEKISSLYNSCNIHISISHSRGNAIAYVVIEGE